MTTKLLAFLRENVLAKLVYINILHIQEKKKLSQLLRLWSNNT